jgi:radical SAM protein with 4Fe4S-binding SPASM domain
VAAIKKRFHKINVEVSNICNLQCSFCPEVIREKKMMSLDLFENIIQQIAPLTELVCFHLMGDPLVHPNLSQMIQICEKYQAQIFFVTNGVLVKPEHHQILLSPAMYQVNFSLHSFFDNYPGKNPSTYLEKIFAWTESALSQRPDLYINYRLWNLQDIRGGLTENIEMLKRIQERFHFSINPSHIQIQKNKSYKIKNKLYLHFDTEFIWPDLKLPVLGQKGTCYGLSSHFGIHADGTVVPCCLDKEASIVLGKIQDTPILEILESPKAQSILSGFKKNKLVEDLCQRCQYIERFN